MIIEDLQNGYCIVMSKDVEYNPQKILMALASDGYKHDVYTFDFYTVENGKKKYVWDIFNRYSFLESLMVRPLIVVARHIYSNLSYCNIQFDFLAKILENGYSIKNVHYPICSFVHQIYRDSYNEEEWESCANRYIKNKTYDGLDIEYVAPYQYRMYSTESYSIKTCVIILSKTPRLAIKCIDSVMENTQGCVTNIVLVWNGTSEHGKMVENKYTDRGLKLLEITESTGFNFARFNNLAAQLHLEACDRFLLINDDVQLLRATCIQEMHGLMSREKAGIVGAALYYPGNWDKNRSRSEVRYQHAGVTLEDDVKRFNHLNKGKEISKYYVSSHECNMVTFALVLIDSKVWKELNGMDEEYHGDCNDLDFCLRAKKAGYGVWYCASAEAIHEESITRAHDPQMQNDQGSRNFYTKHKHELHRIYSI